MKIAQPSSGATAATQWLSRHRTQEMTMTIHRTILAPAVAFALSIGVAHADGLKPVEGQSIQLGEVSGVAYYTVDHDGFRLVATLAQGEGGTPVQIDVLLASSQSL